MCVRVLAGEGGEVWLDVCVRVCVLTGEGGEVRLDVQLLEEHGGGEVDGEVTPGLLRQEDVGPGGGARPAVGRRGLEQDLRRLGRGAAGRDAACRGTEVLGRPV